VRGPQFAVHRVGIGHHVDPERVVRNFSCHTRRP
jgi:hypothetical protein